MAHRIQLPVEFEFEVEQTSYVLGTIRLRKWAAYGLRVDIIAPQELAGEYGIPVSPVYFPSSVKEQLAAPGRSLNPAGKPGRALNLDVAKRDIEVLLCVYPDGCDLEHPPKKKVIDAWQLRHDFLHLKHSMAALSEFLNYYGRWSRLTYPYPELRRQGRTSSLSFSPGLLFGEEMWEQQTEIKDSLRGDRGEWLQKHPLGFGSRSKFPYFVHTDSTCLGAIQTSIGIDFLRRVPFRICKRSDCGIPFPADRKGKQYCSQYCAHIVSVRRSRAQLRKKAGMDQKG